MIHSGITNGGLIESLQIESYLYAMADGIEIVKIAFGVLTNTSCQNVGLV